VKQPEETHPTVSIDKVVMLADVPVLLFPPSGAIESPEIRLLVGAIDGESTVQQIAETAGVDPKHAQAVFAQLRTEGCTPSSRPRMAHTARRHRNPVWPLLRRDLSRIRSRATRFRA
jgi:hypothetical protein